jgi:hypothetical protein
MPRIPEITLDGVAFLYPRAEEAHAHAKIGGTCAFIGRRVYVDGVLKPIYVPYAVSNRHVVWTGGCPVIRINRRDGGKPDVIELECDDWIVHPDGDDLAIANLTGKIDQAIHKISFIGDEKFVTPTLIQVFGIGLGEEVLMMGRLVNHQGRRENRPIVRFGSLSMMPEPIWNKGISRDQLSFVVEMRSRTGFSGSPVAVYRTIATTLTDVPVRDFFAFLGINWGYILDEDGENTWLNGVVPAWKIAETLEVPALKKHQKEAEQRWRAATKNPSDEAEPAVAGVVPASEVNPTHREDFNSLLSAAVKKRGSED